MHKKSLRIIPRKNPEGKITSYQLHLGKTDDQKNARLSFKTLAEAKTARAQYETELANEGSSASLLPPAEKYDAVRALEILRPLNISLLEAANIAADIRRQALRSRPVSDVVTEILAAAEQDGLSPDTLAGYGSSFRRFARSFGDCMVSSLDSVTIDDWLRGLGVANSTRTEWHRKLTTLFNFAKTRNYVRTNPMEQISRPRVERNEPTCLSLNEVRALFMVADAVWIPPLALGIFAGLRPRAEVWKLKWSAINLHTRQIRITLSKVSSSRRVIEMSNVLVAWLEPYAKPDGFVVADRRYHRYVEGRRQLFRCAGALLAEQGIEAPHLSAKNVDIFRHTFGSYHLAFHQNAGLTAELMGHGMSTRTLKDHYRALVDPAQAPAFWQLFPMRALPAPGEDYGLDQHDKPHRDAVNARRRQRRAALDPVTVIPKRNRISKKDLYD
jgi:integrase